MSTISPGQCRAARALLGWTQETLSKKAGVGQSTLKDFEKCGRSPILNNRSAIERAFQDAGIEFQFDAKGVAAGITWTKEPGKAENPDGPGLERGRHRGAAARGPRGK